MADFTPINPAAAFGQGYQIGAGIRNDQLQQQQVQAALAQQAQQRQVLQSLYSNPNPTADDYARASLVLPQLREQLKQSWDIKNADQQQGWLRDVGQTYAALQSGRPDLAVQQLNDRADLLQQQGASAREVNALRYQARMVQQNPDFARSYAGMMLAAAPGGDKVISSLNTLGNEQRAQAQAPADLAKKNAEAGISQAQAEVAPERNALEVRNLGEDAETKAQARRIADLDVQIRQANSETQRGQLVLERDKLVAEQQQKAETKAQAAQGALDSATQGISTVDALLNHPGLSGWFGAGTIAGKQSALIPGTDAKDFREQLDVVKSQQFMSGIQKMREVGGALGGLSEKEGDKIQSAVAAINADMSEKQLRASLGVIRSNLESARRRAIANSNLPTSGGGFVVNSPTYGKVSEGDINRLLTRYPGATREQVLQFLQKQGGAAAPAVGGATGGF